MDCKVYEFERTQSGDFALGVQSETGQEFSALRGADRLGELYRGEDSAIDVDAQRLSDFFLIRRQKQAITVYCSQRIQKGTTYFAKVYARVAKFGENDYYGSVFRLEFLKPSTDIDRSTGALAHTWRAYKVVESAD